MEFIGQRFLPAEMRANLTPEEREVHRVAREAVAALVTDMLEQVKQEDGPESQDLGAHQEEVRSVPNAFFLWVRALKSDDPGPCVFETASFGLAATTEVVLSLPKQQRPLVLARMSLLLGRLYPGLEAIASLVSTLGGKDF